MFVVGHMTREPVCVGPVVVLREVVQTIALHKHGAEIKSAIAARVRVGSQPRSCV